MKLYADEDEHEAVRALQALAASALARVEVPAALWRKQRIGDVTGAQAGTLVRAFEADWHGTPDDPPRFAVVGVSGVTLDRAAALVAAHGLRAYDAVQLAAALAVRDADPGCATFACFDAELRRAAAASGFTLLPS